MTRCFLWKIVNCELPGKMTLRCGAAPAIHCIQKSAQRGALCIPTTNSTRLNLPLSPHSPDLRGHSPSPILQLYTAKNRWTPYPSYPYPPLPSSLCLCVTHPHSTFSTFSTRLNLSHAETRRTQSGGIGRPNEF